MSNIIVSDPAPATPPPIPPVELKFGMMGDYFVIQTIATSIFDRETGRRLLERMGRTVDEGPRVLAPDGGPRIVVPG